jgi:hypothetical protein
LGHLVHSLRATRSSEAGSGDGATFDAFVASATPIIESFHFE